MQNKQILFLVAGKNQLPVIKYAKEKGYYVITCDNNKDNIGHQYADRVIIESAYNYDQILQELSDTKIDGVLSFISTHGLKSTSHISEKLNLNSINLEAIETVSSKSDFRVFLRENNFAVPNFISLPDRASYSVDAIKALEFPIIIKPVDNSANRGIKKIKSFDRTIVDDAINDAFNNSPTEEIIIEEFISSNKRINGDGIFLDNKILYSMIGDYYYDEKVNEILPYATSFPSENLTEEIFSEVERLFRTLNYGNGIFNFEAIIKDNKVYFIEINPRHSGNFIYKLMAEDTGISLEEINVEIALGNFIPYLNIRSKNKFLAYCSLYSDKKGVLRKINISSELEQYIIEREDYKFPGDSINKFDSTADKVSLLHLEFNTIDKMKYTLKNIRNFFDLEIE